MRQQQLTWMQWLETHELGNPKVDEHDGGYRAYLPDVYLQRPGRQLKAASTKAAWDDPESALHALRELMAGARVIRSGPTVDPLELTAPDAWPDEGLEAERQRRASEQTVNELNRLKAGLALRGYPTEGNTVSRALYAIDSAVTAGETLGSRAPEDIPPSPPAYGADQFVRATRILQPHQSRLGMTLVEAAAEIVGELSRLRREAVEVRDYLGTTFSCPSPTEGTLLQLFQAALGTVHAQRDAAPTEEGAIARAACDALGFDVEDVTPNDVTEAIARLKEPTHGAERQIRQPRPSVGVAKCVDLGPEAFRFDSYQDWLHNGKERYEEARLTFENAVAIDAQGRLCMCGADFCRARYPVRVHPTDPTE